MIASVRDSLPVGFAYEVIIVDGGSSDGTIEWCQRQRDVRLIEQGELLGAVRAFNAGAYASSAKYVVMANDDIIFEKQALLNAFFYLENTPVCGMVAFSDDRVAPYKVATSTRFGVQLIRGSRENLIYGQVCMLRRWLGNLVGWWGHDDPVMRHAHTYGGDNYLSARIWELGYKISAVKDVNVRDTVHHDQLRDINYAKEEANRGLFYKRYPDVLHLPPGPLIPPRDTPELRILYLPIYEPGWAIQRTQKHGLRDALAEYAVVWEYDYMNARSNALLDLIDVFQPDILFLQCHDAERITPALLAQAKAEREGMIVINWVGDVWDGCYTSDAMLALYQQVDLALGVNVSALEALSQQTGTPTAYWQIAFEPVCADLPDMPAHDVVFLANAYSPERKALEAVLRGLNANVGMYGAGWETADGQTLYDFATGAAIYRKAKLAISDNQFPDAYGFVSNRLFEAMANGVCLLQQMVPGLRELTGLENNVHYVGWETVDDLKVQIDYYLKHEDKRLSIARSGELFVRSRHSFNARVDELFSELIDKVGTGAALELV
jgi:glycosyltransferase involved in cell wall biosynthesis